MSNLVDASALQNSQGNVPNWVQNQNMIQKPQNVIPVVAPIQARADASPNMVNGAKPSGGLFRENTTKLNVYFTGKLNSWKDSCVSKIINPQQADSVFKTPGATQLHNVTLVSEQSNESKPDLTKAIVTSINILSTYNSLPVAVRFDWTGQGDTSGLCDLQGKSFPLQINPGDNSRGLKINVYDAKNAMNDPILVKYGHVNLETMWKQIQLIQTPSGEYALVPADHEALRIIRLNQGKFGPPPKESDLVEGLYKMSPRQIGAAIDEMWTNILSKFNFTDLTKFKVDMYRQDGRNFNDINGTSWDHFEPADQEFQKNMNVSAGFEMEITWTSPQPEPKQKALNVSLASPVNTVTQIPTQYNAFQSATYASSKPPM